MLSNEWCSSLKWGSVKLSGISIRPMQVHPFLSAMDVFPTYCLLQTLHVIKYSALVVLHAWRPFMRRWPQTLLWMFVLWASVCMSGSVSSCTALTPLWDFPVWVWPLPFFEAFVSSEGYHWLFRKNTIGLCVCVNDLPVFVNDVLYVWEILVVRSTQEQQVRCLCHTFYKSMSLGFKFRCTFGWS